MQEEQLLHEQLSPLPAGIPPISPLSTSSLTTPSNKKKKLLKVILKVPPSPNPNINNRPCPSLSSSPPSSPSSLSTTHLIPPQHHHHLQQHQLHHHQQRFLQHQHLRKQRFLQQQAQQLASELQIKLHQQHFLQQEHPRLLEQFKQQLEQEQIRLQPSDFAGGDPGYSLPTREGEPHDLTQGEERGNAGEPHSSHERAGSSLNVQEAASSLRQQSRLRETSCKVPQEERIPSQKSRFQSEDEAVLANCDGLYEQSHRRGLRDAQWEPSAKRPKVSNQHLDDSPTSPGSQWHKDSSTRSQHVVAPHKPLGSNGLVQSFRVASSKPIGIGHLFSAGPYTSDARILHSNLLFAVPTARDDVAVAGAVARPSIEGSGLQNEGATKTPLSKDAGGNGKVNFPGRKALRGILDKLQKKDRFGAFSEPVDAKEVPDYYDVIKDPMDFGTMRKRITAGYYTRLELFEKDIFTICSNAMTFNAAGTVYYRHARAIKTAAERLLEALRLCGSAVLDECASNQKTPLASMKKSHKKKQPLKPWTSEYVSEVATGCPSGRTFPAYPADSYYVDWQDGSGCLSTKSFREEFDDTPGLLGLNDGRRLEESHRNTYRPKSDHGASPLLNTVRDGPLLLVPAAYQLEFSYARSLARFAADLGPDAWKVASEKIQRTLPLGVPFGPGWVGERDILSRSLPLPTTRGQAQGFTDSRGKAETCVSEAGPSASGPSASGRCSVLSRMRGEMYGKCSLLNEEPHHVLPIEQDGLNMCNSRLCYGELQQNGVVTRLTKGGDGRDSGPLINWRGNPGAQHNDPS